MSGSFGNPDWPDTGGTCCYGAGVYGPDRCTCWREVYDLTQEPIREDLVALLAAGIEPVTRRRMCAGCAYRPDSPERRGDPRHVGDGDGDELERIAGQARFWCHEGIPRVVSYEHPSGATAPGHPSSYEPVVRDGVPYRARRCPRLRRSRPITGDDDSNRRAEQLVCEWLDEVLRESMT